MVQACFGLMITFFIVHELDSVKRHEWRMLPLISRLPDKTAEQVFIWAHVPLVLLVFWISAQGIASGPAIALSGFSVVHVLLHWFFRAHPANEFSGFAAWLPIIAAACFGGLHLVLVAG